MSIIDKVKRMIGQNPDKARRGITKAGDMIDKKTGGKYSDKIDTARQKATKYTDRLGERPGEGPR
jgi:antitoxin protein of toxin-antitoxin system